MRNYIIIFSVLVLAIFLNACNTNKSNLIERNLTAAQKSYLGQKPPGLEPEPFAPGLVTTSGWEYWGGLTPDLKEFYFIREGEDKDGKSTMELVVVQNNYNQWQKSVVSPRVGTPFISPDGKTMYLSKKYRERTNKGA